MKRILLPMTLCLLGVGQHALAQEPWQPGPEHKLLEKFVGQWTCEIAAPGQPTAEGTSRYRMDLNGLHLLQEFSADLGGIAFKGRATTSYCPLRKKYLSTWIDSMSGSPTNMEGTISEDGKQLTEEGVGPSPNGLATYKSTTRWLDDDTYHFTLYAVSDGNEQEVMQITYRRQK